MHALSRGLTVHASIVDEGVDAARVLVPHRRRQPPHLAEVTQVCDVGVHSPARSPATPRRSGRRSRLLDTRRSRVDPLLAAAVDEDGRAGSGQPQSGVLANAVGAASDKEGLVGEVGAAAAAWNGLGECCPGAMARATMRGARSVPHCADYWR